jgi:voltage-gated potassium channel
MVSKTVGAISQEMGQKIIGLQRDQKDRLFPDDETTLQKIDMILFMDEVCTLEENGTESKTAPPKLVIIDDNPVILTLYTRLFQKAGFHPLTAENGEEGFSLIVKEKPVAAVIDYMLPVLSGIDVCRKLREEEASQNIKLILFTADDHPDTRSRALAAGADEVVVKSPEASEVVHTVTQILSK